MVLHTRRKLSEDDVRAVVAPTSGMVRQQTGSDLHAWICGGCGFQRLGLTGCAVVALIWVTLGVSIVRG